MAGSKKILLVEDDTYISDLYKLVLSGAGHTVEVVARGDAVGDHVKEFDPDLVLLDIMMPGMTGLEVLKMLRTDPQYANMKYKVIMLTNLAQESTADEAKKYDADGYIVKVDITPHQLVEIISEV